MYANLPKQTTETKIPYTSILRVARLQMSRVRLNEAPPSSPSKRSADSSMDCEMDDFRHQRTTDPPLQRSALPLSTATLFHTAATPPTKAVTSSGRASACVKNDNMSVGAHPTPVCICLTCERAAMEAKAAAALHLQMSLFERGTVGYAC